MKQIESLPVILFNRLKYISSSFLITHWPLKHPYSPIFYYNRVDSNPDRVILTSRSFNGAYNMKISIWDILTGITLLGILCLIGGFGAILMNPNVAFNPFPPAAAATLVPTIPLPTVTETNSLPPTWTPVATGTTRPKTISTLRATSTPYPTFTAVFLPSFTPSRTARAAVSGGSCTVVSQSPTDGTFKTAGEEFDTSWTIKNTGEEVWRADSTDIAFISGDSIHIGSDLRDMPYDVSPGSQLNVNIHMKAPTAAGSYTANWALRNGSRSVCQFFVKINVQ